MNPHPVGCYGCEESWTESPPQVSAGNGKLPDSLRFSHTLTKFNGIAVQGETQRPRRGKGKEKRIYCRFKTPQSCYISMNYPSASKWLVPKEHFLVSTLLTCTTWVNPLSDLLSLAGGPVSPSAMRDQAGPRP